MAAVAVSVDKTDIASAVGSAADKTADAVVVTAAAVVVAAAAGSADCSTVVGVTAEAPARDLRFQIVHEKVYFHNCAGLAASLVAVSASERVRVLASQFRLAHVKGYP